MPADAVSSQAGTDSRIHRCILLRRISAKKNQLCDYYTDSQFANWTNGSVVDTASHNFQLPL